MDELVQQIEALSDDQLIEIVASFNDEEQKAVYSIGLKTFHELLVNRSQEFFDEITEANNGQRAKQELFTVLTIIGMVAGKLVGWGLMGSAAAT